MDETEFHARAESSLEALESALEAADIDAELQGGILTITVGGGQFVLNRHAPTRQLWFSSPVSGAARFGYDPALDDWKHAVTEETLNAVLKRELGIKGIA